MATTICTIPTLNINEDNNSLNGSCGGSFRYTWNPYSPKGKNYYASSSDSNVSFEEPSVVTSDVDNEEDDDILYALGMIASLREEPTDVALQQTIARLPTRTHILLLNALEQNEELLMELMSKERGNVVAQLIAVIGGANCANLIDYVVSKTVDLCLNQSGCIAYSRIYDAAAPEQQKLMSSVVSAELPTLATHQFGNYVVQCIMKSGDVIIFNAVKEYLAQGEVLATVCTNKFGSHVAETFIKQSCSVDVVVVCKHFLSSEKMIRILAADKFGNYFVQHVLRRIQTLPACADLTQWCLSHIPTVVDGTPFALNINRALGTAPMRNKKRMSHH